MSLEESFFLLFRDDNLLNRTHVYDLNPEKISGLHFLRVPSEKGGAAGLQLWADQSVNQPFQPLWRWWWRLR